MTGLAGGAHSRTRAICRDRPVGAASLALGACGCPPPRTSNLRAHSIPWPVRLRLKLRTHLADIVELRRDKHGGEQAFAVVLSTARENVSQLRRCGARTPHRCARECESHWWSLSGTVQSARTTFDAAQERLQLGDLVVKAFLRSCTGSPRGRTAISALGRFPPSASAWFVPPERRPLAAAPHW